MTSTAYEAVPTHSNSEVFCVESSCAIDANRDSSRLLHSHSQAIYQNAHDSMAGVRPKHLAIHRQDLWWEYVRRVPVGSRQSTEQVTSKRNSHTDHRRGIRAIRKAMDCPACEGAQAPKNETRHGVMLTDSREENGGAIMNVH